MYTEQFSSWYAGSYTICEYITFFETWIPSLDPFSVGIDFRRQNLTAVDSRTESTNNFIIIIAVDP